MADDDLPTEPAPAVTAVGPSAGWSVRDLVAELANAEDDLRNRPGDPDAVDRMRELVRELRRRRALMRLEVRRDPRVGR